MFLFCILLVTALGVSCQDLGSTCYRPVKYLTIEQDCKKDPMVISSTGTFYEQMKENVQAAIDQTKKIFNMAKKKLGMDTTEEAIPMKKCEFYQCIFRKMDALKGDSYPNLTAVNQWIGENVENAQESMIFDHVENCFKEVNIDDASFIKAKTNIPPSCDSAKELMKCLDLESMCTPFSFP